MTRGSSDSWSWLITHLRTSTKSIDEESSELNYKRKSHIHMYYIWFFLRHLFYSKYQSKIFFSMDNNISLKYCILIMILTMMISYILLTHFPWLLNTFTSTQQYLVASWTCHSPRPLTSLNLHTKRHYCCYFRHKCLWRKSESLCSILIVFSVILSDVKAKTLPLAQKWSGVKVLISMICLWHRLTK